MACRYHATFTNLMQCVLMMTTTVVADRRLSPVLWFVLSLWRLRLFLSTFELNEGLQSHFLWTRMKARFFLPVTCWGNFQRFFPFPVEWWWWWPISRRRGVLGRLMVSSCMLVGDCRVRFLMHRSAGGQPFTRFMLESDRRFRSLSYTSYSEICLVV